MKEEVPARRINNKYFSFLSLNANDKKEIQRNGDEKVNATLLAALQFDVTNHFVS